MKLTLPFIFIASVLLACNDSNRHNPEGDAEATVASEAGEPAPLPKDVIYASSPLISGNLYARPSFGGTIIAHFDTSQRLHIIDTTDNVFVKVRMQQDTSTHTGYISKIILPEQK
ncbi:SH3 domain-containing protein [Pontibacter diazotrophicus]|uniref:SH3 domain-containing protein n=1 Tax=Pontibacter diazotrophicus TaxID=1400979 RepID=UPI001FE96AF5|nr:SH3 domain-containing protein [Pontibacter diazotrophicus]